MCPEVTEGSFFIVKVKYRLPYQGKFCCCSVYVIFVIILGRFGETGVVTVCGGNLWKCNGYGGNFWKCSCGGNLWK